MTKPKKTAVSVSELLAGIISWPTEYSVQITGISADSRKVTPGDLYIACFGPTKDHPHYVVEAIEKGAAAVLQEGTDDSVTVISKNNRQHIPIINVSGLKQKLSHIAVRFYNDPSAKMNIVGITGTNGKTSCSQFIAHALELAGHPCGVIGTLGHGFPGHLQTGFLTTPDTLSLQQELVQLLQQGAKSIAMEVSSHSLVQNRIAGVRFNTAIFTNLTRDHLDYHGDMEHYGQAKRQLFLQPGLQHAIINADDPFGRSLISEFRSKLSCYAYSIQENLPDLDVPGIFAKNIKLNAHGFSAHVETPWGQGTLQSHLLGRFNLSNLLATLTTLGVMQIPLDDILHYLSTLTVVPGRMQSFGGTKLPLVVVDYAHTPDALEKALTALREHCHGKLWCVFGCGGNRDKGKRELMAQIAERLSDQILITDDNPRDEDPKNIVDDILKGLLCPWAAEIEHNRSSAIAHAIDCAEAGDIVLIAGKGHEKYQEIGHEKIPFDDAEQVHMQLAAKASSMTMTVHHLEAK